MPDFGEAKFILGKDIVKNKEAPSAFPKNNIPRRS
jgi:hypothetical protein